MDFCILTSLRYRQIDRTEDVTSHMPLFYGIEVYRSHGAPQESASGMQHEPQLCLDAHARAHVASHARENVIRENVSIMIRLYHSLSVSFSTHFLDKLTINYKRFKMEIFVNSNGNNFLILTLRKCFHAALSFP